MKIPPRSAAFFFAAARAADSFSLSLSAGAFFSFAVPLSNGIIDGFITNGSQAPSTR